MGAPPVIELSGGGARARIAALGAEAVGWSVGGVDMLWTLDPAVWDATAPVLFPVCGWTRAGRVMIGGESYPLGLHGFARFETFDLAEADADRARFVLRDTPATRARYPYRFELEIDYRLGERRLDVAARVKNTGNEPLPYAFGLHPGFRLLPGGGHEVVFDRPERPQVPEIAAGGLFSPRRRHIELIDGRRLALRHDTFSREALCFLDASSQGLDLVGPGGRILRVEMDNFRHIVLWSRPGAPFLCVESWTGYGDPEGFRGELADKPSMTILNPGESARHSAAYLAGPK